MLFTYCFVWPIIKNLVTKESLGEKSLETLECLFRIIFIRIINNSNKGLSAGTGNLCILVTCD